MRRTAITVNYLQMLCLLVVLLLSSKSYFSRWGTAFLRRVALVLGYCFLRRVYFVCWGACFLRRVALHAVLSAFGFFEGLLLLVGLLGLLRGGLLSLAFSVSINKLKIYEQHFMIQFYKLQLLGFLVWSSGPDLGLLWSYSSEMLSV